MRQRSSRLTTETLEHYGYALPELLLRIRALHHLTQNELAEAIGYRRASISNWEQGKTLLRADTLLDLLDRFPIPTRAEAAEPKPDAALPDVVPDSPDIVAAVVLPPTTVTPTLPLPIAIRQTVRGVCLVCRKVRIATVLVDPTSREERGLLCVLHTLASELLEERADYTRRLLELHEKHGSKP